jgi:hypothetical protein
LNKIEDRKEEWRKTVGRHEVFIQEEKKEGGGGGKEERES